MNSAVPVRKSRWPFIIVGMLVVHIMLMAVAVVMSTRHRPAIVPNYYQQALKWDQAQAQRRASEELGWKVTFEPSTIISPLGQRDISIRIVDRDNQPVADAYIEIAYFHHAHADETLTSTMRTDARGVATQSMKMRNEGWWQIQLVASSSTGRYITTLTQYISNGKGGRA